MGFTSVCKSDIFKIHKWYVFLDMIPNMCGLRKQNKQFQMRIAKSKFAFGFRNGIKLNYNSVSGLNWFGFGYGFGVGPKQIGPCIRKHMDKQKTHTHIQYLNVIWLYDFKYKIATSKQYVFCGVKNIQKQTRI